MTKLSASATTTEIPMTFRIFGGKTAIVLPDGSRAIARQEATIDSTMVKIIARAFRWQRLLDDGTYATIDDMAASEKISPSYVSRVVRLALLSPEIVETILDGRQPAHLTMKNLLERFPVDWAEQREHFLSSGNLAGENLKKSLNFRTMRSD